MKYLYFRAVTDQANDDATGDSALFPLSSLMGMQPTSDTALTLYFTPIVRRMPSGNEPDADASFDNHDTVVLTVTSNRHKEAMQDIMNNISGSITVIADDLTTTHLTGTHGRTGVAIDETVTASYISTYITACVSINVSAAYAN